MNTVINNYLKGNKINKIGAFLKKSEDYTSLGKGFRWLFGNPKSDGDFSGFDTGLSASKSALNFTDKAQKQFNKNWIDTKKVKNYSVDPMQYVGNFTKDYTAMGGGLGGTAYAGIAGGLDYYDNNRSVWDKAHDLSHVLEYGGKATDAMRLTRNAGETMGRFGMKARTFLNTGELIGEQASKYSAGKAAVPLAVADAAAKTIDAASQEVMANPNEYQYIYNYCQDAAQKELESQGIDTSTPEGQTQLMNRTVGKMQGEIILHSPGLALYGTNKWIANTFGMGLNGATAADYDMTSDKNALRDYAQTRKRQDPNWQSGMRDAKIEAAPKTWNNLPRRTWNSIYNTGGDAINWLTDW